MLARTTRVECKDGVHVSTPLLIPSFSSKGSEFARVRGTKKIFSTVAFNLEVIGPHIANSMLVSAYDLHHRFLPRPQRYFRGKQLLFLDSGGYELAPEYDSTEPMQGAHRGPPFSKVDYLRVLRHLPDWLPVVMANFDWDSRGKSVEVQIAEAIKIFSDFPHFLSDFIVKPPGRKRRVEVSDLLPHLAEFKRFDFLGVTEKELGDSLLTRLNNLGRLRAAMDECGVRVPIHVWGGLDPLTTPLYFFVGAEVFDGVSWLRYSYWRGMAVSRDAYAVLGPGVETPPEELLALRLNENVMALDGLTEALRRFVSLSGSDFGMFEERAGVLERAYRTMMKRIPGLRR